MVEQRGFIQNKIAIVYDFDGTLSPQPMQEYTVLPELGIPAADFWEDVAEEAKQSESEPMLSYMRLLLERAEKKGMHLDKEKLAELAAKIQYFPGVETWFDRINKFIETETKETSKITLEHYIISAGMKEILDGVSIKEHFANIFASAYYFGHDHVATFPKQLITDTTKTQFLFRINKGKQKLGENINEHTPEYKRPIPFPNMIYIGDGLTDVPSMAVTKQGGGHAIAVYAPDECKEKDRCKSLMGAGRVDFIAPADYSAGSVLEKRIKLLLKSVIANIEYQEELFNCQQENSLLSIEP